MRVGRTLPPASSPIHWGNILNGIAALFRTDSERVRFEAELKRYFGRQGCFLVSSGKTALVIALQTLKRIRPGKSRVVVPAYICFSVPSAIVRAGLDVVLCDVDPATLDYDYSNLEQVLDDEKVLCVLTGHLFGRPAAVDRLRRAIGPRPVYLIEDAAQSLGGRDADGYLGTAGDVAIFSLGRGKAFSTVEGGIVLADDQTIRENLSSVYGCLSEYSRFETTKLLLYAIALKLLIHPWLFWLPKALPFLRIGETIYDPGFPMRKLSAFQAGLSENWEEQLTALRDKRAHLARHWFSVLNGAGEGTNLRDSEHADLIRYPWRIENAARRKWLLAESERKGLGIVGTYPGSVASIPEIGDNNVYPGAEQCVDQLVTLPVHPLLSARDIDVITELIHESKKLCGK